jgi:hypothetical protein
MKFILIVLVNLFVSISIAKEFRIDKFKIEVLPLSGFRMNLSTASVLIEQIGSVRYPERVRISITKALIPGNLKEKKIGFKTVEYSTNSQTEGSGGTEFTTTAFERVGGKFVQYEHRSQSESLDPDLKVLWEVIKRTKVRNY